MVSGAAPAARSALTGADPGCFAGGSTSTAAAITATDTPTVAIMSPGVPVWGRASSGRVSAPSPAPTAPTAAETPYAVSAAADPRSSALTDHRAGRPPRPRRTSDRTTTT